MQLGDLGERCKLPQCGLGQSPSRQRIWCILKAKIIALGVTFLWFAEEKIEHFAKLKQKKAKDKHIRAWKASSLGEEEQQKEAQQRTCQKHHPARANQMFYRMMLMIPKTPLPVCTVKFSNSPVLSGLSVKYVSSGLAQSVLVQLQIKQVSKKRDARRSWRKANSSYCGVRTETKRPFQVATS